ncbi:MAG: TIGR04053 family radical SAM/SPASM domain-containing protein [Candidatus Brocadiae bacterium]|nr:TIGR04053 family radical SAM/SPASM domain-containing protein [Candidatus Brocadiia bacterium]
MLDVDFNRNPFIVIWEITQACDLACVHCRAEARPWRDSRELTTAEGKALIDRIAEFGSPLFVITGGDPLKRPDLMELIDHAVSRGLRTTLTPSGTRLMTKEIIQRLKDHGLSRLAVSLDGSHPAIHDEFRKVEGSFDWTLQCIRWAREVDLPVQINSTVCKLNMADFDALAELLKTLDIALWAVFFLVPVGRGLRSDIISARDHEVMLNRIYDWTRTLPFDIKTTAAQHYRRVVMQRIAQEKAAGAGDPAGAAAPFFTRLSATPGFSLGDVGRAAKGVNDANGFVFIGHTGDVCPSGFLPLAAGNVRDRSIVDMYRNDPLFTDMRDYSKLKGKCGWCDFRDVCGGSRSRAWGVTGDVLESEPYCVYVPPRPEGLLERIGKAELEKAENFVK